LSSACVRATTTSFTGYKNTRPARGGPASLLQRAESARCFRRRFFGLGFRPIQQLDERERRVVADTETGLQDAQIAARAALVARTEFCKKLHDDFAVTQAVESKASIGDGGFFR